MPSSVVAIKKAGEIVGYRAVVYLPGTRNQISKKGVGATLAAQKRSATEFARDLLNKRDAKELPGQTPAPTVETVGDYLARWIEGVQVKESTLKRYRQLLAHVTREAGTVKLTEFTPMHVREIYAHLRDRGSNPKTILNVHRVLRMALEEAHDTDHLIPENPVSKKLAPRAPRFEVSPPTPEETRRLIDAAYAYTQDDTDYGAIVSVAAWTGARQGELLSLLWADVDLDAPVLSIRQSKTKTGRRLIPLTPGTVSVLRAHRTRQIEQRLARGASWHDTGYIFTTGIGTQIDGGNLRRAWGVICKRAGVKARFHDLRHFFATVLLGQNVHPKIVSSLLGHAKITLTLDTYSHLIPALGLEAQAMATLDKALGARASG